jgi:eukaryotic-like serine/threonine-protein kinase
MSITPQASLLNKLLDGALQQPPAKRMAWVDALGAEYESVKPRLRALLARSSEQEAESGLITLPKLDETHSGSAAPQCGQIAGTQVGPYRLVRRLGIGGMAVVWLATGEFSVPQRVVALKFAHVTAKRADLAARLGRERQMLEALEHPNIARLHDAGVTVKGQLYLVLEYVDGLALDQYCTQHRCDLALRLALFVQVADALTHAHERRIIHRDLKPSNVLVTRNGETRLLDFGIAKLLEGGAPQLDLSRLNGCPLTPEYASPEQITGTSVGFASDIYSLGVMLYELVTGARPYFFKRGSNRALREAITSTIPLPPSSVTNDLTRKAHLKGDLDETIMRALQKQPEQRYASMHEFAERIEHHARRLARLRHGP